MEEIHATIRFLLLKMMFSLMPILFHQPDIKSILQEFEKYEVTIMDRQGAVIMKKSPYDNSFNGSDSNGKELENGVYFYYLKHTEQDIKFKGYIQVIR